MRAALALAVLSTLCLTACPATGIVCNAGTVGCNAGCVDINNDKRNCGGCGKSCGLNEECLMGTCGCTNGAVACNGECVLTTSDAKHCGQCGNACAAGQVCENSTCKQSCTVGTNQLCGTACVDEANDPNNCGACGNVCGNGQSCRNSSCTYDVVAACYWSGQAVGLNATSLTLGPKADLGTNPGALAVMQGTLLSADGQDQRVYQAKISAAGIQQTSSATRVGQVPNQVLVDGTTAYVVNATTGTLQVLSLASDAGLISLDAGVAGLALGTAAELNFGMNSYPQGVAKASGALWVPLYGGFGAAAADAGQQIVKVDISGAAPVESGRIDLRTLNLQPFDGGSPVARPWAITTHGGKVYVVLNNLNADTYAPEGPGLLAKVDPTASSVTTVGLGTGCLNPQWAAEVGSRLAVSCGGRVAYTPSYTVDHVDQAGVVLLDSSDSVQATWSASCPADAGVLADGGAACAPLLPGRFTVRGTRLFLGDQNAGRIVVLDVSDAGLTEVRGTANAINTCPVSTLTGAANVADLVSLP